MVAKDRVESRVDVLFSRIRMREEEEDADADAAFLLYIPPLSLPRPLTPPLPTLFPKIHSTSMFLDRRSVTPRARKFVDSRGISFIPSFFNCAK